MLHLWQRQGKPHDFNASAVIRIVVLFLSHRLALRLCERGIVVLCLSRRRALRLCERGRMLFLCLSRGLALRPYKRAFCRAHLPAAETGLAADRVAGGGCRQLPTAFCRAYPTVAPWQRPVESSTCTARRVVYVHRASVDTRQSSPVQFSSVQFSSVQFSSVHTCGTSTDLPPCQSR